VTAFRRADKRGDARGAFNLAVLLEQRGDHRRALRFYGRAQKLGPPDIADMARARMLDLARHGNGSTAARNGGGHDAP
jgi:TPR repeat protein